MIFQDRGLSLADRACVAAVGHDPWASATMQAGAVTSMSEALDAYAYGSHLNGEDGDANRGRPAKRTKIDFDKAALGTMLTKTSPSSWGAAGPT